MKPLKNNKGLTLIEIIIAIAILGIILIALLSAFTFGLNNLVFSGQKSEKAMELQTIVDDLNARSYTTRFEDDGVTVDVSARDSLISDLSGDGYNQVSDLDQISTKAEGEDVNFYVSDLETKAGSKGCSVTILKFTDNGKRHSQLSTFVLDGGY